MQDEIARAAGARLAKTGFAVYKVFMSGTIETIALEIPREIPHVTRMTPAELKKELAITLFAQGKISFGKARELAAVTVWQFQNELGARGIPGHYDREDFAEDVATLRELGRL